MAINRGKEFESRFRKAFEKDPRNISIDRFPDPAMGFAGIRNICDFVVYRKPSQFYFECKAFHGNTLNFKTGITENQWEGLLEKSTTYGVIAGIVIWFVDYDITTFIRIETLNQFRIDGKKSINIKDIEANNLRHTIVPGKKLIKFFEYDAQEFLSTLNAGR